ncbi:MAG TPA: M56 family metallopeptidase [Gemmatimonadaceae bacterium]
MTSFVLALLAKVTLIFAAGLLLNAIIRRGSSSLRHLVLLASLVCAVTLPVAMLMSPRWDVGVLPRSWFAATSEVTTLTNAGDVTRTSDRSSLIASRTTTIPTDEAAPGRITPPTRDGVSPAMDPAVAVALTWPVGLIAVLGWLTVGRLRLRRFAREAWPLSNPEWQRILDAVRVEAGVTRELKLMSSPAVSTPLTWGTRSPVILLPDDALDWTEDHRRVVLRHEIAHVARGDSFAQLVAGFVCAIYWFHPLVWITERRLRAECERACDDRVVSLGTPAADYAAHLLEVARSARSFGAPGFLSVAMARPSQLEGRLLAVLNGSRKRVEASRGARFAAVAISVFLLLPLAAFHPAPRQALLDEAAALSTTPAVNNLYSNATSDESNAKPVGIEEKSESKLADSKQKKQLDSTFQLSAPARSGGTLYLNLKTGGGVTIRGWDRQEVLVRARLGGRDWRDTRVTLEPSSGDATLESVFARWSNNQSTSHDFDIQLPREYNVRIRSSGGSVNIADVNGTFTGNTGGGEIDIRSVSGRVDISTGGGEVNVSDSNVDGKVSTGGGLVRIVRVNGRFRGSSGSGPVIYSESNGGGKGYGAGYGKGASASASDSKSASAAALASAGPIRMTQAGGSVYLPSAPSGASVSTGGGRIVIGPSGGAVDAHTGGGDIEIGPASGSVEATTGAGNVDIAFRGSGSVDVLAGVGNVTITAPGELNATLDLTTAYTDKFGRKTRIISDWPVTVTETGELDTSRGTPRRYVRVRQQVGRGGPLIRVETTNGDIVLKRGS